MSVVTQHSRESGVKSDRTSDRAPLPGSDGVKLRNDHDLAPKHPRQPTCNRVGCWRVYDMGLTSSDAVQTARRLYFATSNHARDTSMNLSAVDMLAHT